MPPPPSSLTEEQVVARIRPRRRVTGMSAVLLPFTADGEVEWAAVEAHLARTAAVGLTPRRYQSGEQDYHGRISKRGHSPTRLHLVQAATVLLISVKRWSALKAWGVRLVNRIGFNKAKVAVARKLATILYRIWRDQSEFRWGKATMDPAASAAATS